MRISTKGRYSLEAMLYLTLKDGEGYLSTRAIAEGTGLPEGYLEQLFIPLRHAGLIKGIRGPAGGYLPGKPPETVTAGEVLRAAEGRLEPVDCVKSTACPVKDSCGSRHTWEELSAAINDCVDSLTLADLARAYHNMDMVEYSI